MIIEHILNIYSLMCRWVWASIMTRFTLFALCITLWLGFIWWKLRVASCRAKCEIKYSLADHWLGIYTHECTPGRWLCWRPSGHSCGRSLRSSMLGLEIGASLSAKLLVHINRSLNIYSQPSTYRLMATGTMPKLENYWQIIEHILTYLDSDLVDISDKV